MRRWLPFVLILLLALAALHSGRRSRPKNATARTAPPGGAVLFTRYCAGCHGATGEGREGVADLHQVDWRKVDVRRVVERGKGRMPPVPIRGSELDTLLLYVRFGL